MTAGATYTPIATNTVSGSSTNTITFSSIPQTYTDLILVTNWSGGDYSAIRVNGDTGSNYSETLVAGAGSSVGSARNSNYNLFDFQVAGQSNVEMTQIVQFMNYSNATTYKTLLARLSNAASGSYVGAHALLWRSTSAITSITFFNQTSSLYWAAGSTFTLYGIASA